MCGGSRSKTTAGDNPGRDNKTMMRQKMKMKLAVLVVLAALAGCNTVSGVGQDISSGANRVSGWLGG
jgi:predicted small secreted protein